MCNFISRVLEVVLTVAVMYYENDDNDDGGGDTDGCSDGGGGSDDDKYDDNEKYVVVTVADDNEHVKTIQMIRMTSCVDCSCENGGNRHAITAWRLELLMTVVDIFQYVIVAAILFMNNCFFHKL